MACFASVLTVLLQVAVACADEPQESWEIRGRVVDEQGRAVEEFDAATFWVANGKMWDESGKLIVYEKQEDWPKRWKQEGVMAAWPSRLAKHAPGGGFTITVEDQDRVAVFAMDRTQLHGGYVSVEQRDAEKPVTITLAPLVRVLGTVYCPEAKKMPYWSMAAVHLPVDKKSSLLITHCGSMKGRFSFLLPPGTYDLDVYGELESDDTIDVRMPKPHERRHHDAPADMRRSLGGIRIEVPAGQAALDLGVLDVIPINSPSLDYLAQFAGQRPPELAITDARGVPKPVKLADFRGKWVLLEFWGVGCRPCVEESLPALSRLYEKHADRRERFEILAICGNWTGEIRTMDDHDRLAAPIVKDVWGGKPLPFPILIDGDGQTFEAYGIGRIPKSLLIDPDGNLVPDGDEKLLAEKLAAP